MSDKNSKPTLLQITWSIVAAFCGIQSDRVLDRDDAYIDEAGFMPYIIIGVLMTILFVLAIYGIVQLVLRQAAT